jgi:hypothetical protein
VKVSGVSGIHYDLSADARVQLFLFQQFLMLFLLTPIPAPWHSPPTPSSGRSRRGRWSRCWRRR